jgi:hypothetical protein
VVVQIPDDFDEVLPNEVRQHETVVNLRAHLTSGVRYGVCQKRAKSARASSCWAIAVFGCGVISKP